MVLAKSAMEEYAFVYPFVEGLMEEWPLLESDYVISKETECLSDRVLVTGFYDIDN